MVLNKLKVASSAILITATILHAGISYADDSEIFFGSEQFSNVAKPNILFLLDYSTSMRDVTIPNSNGTRRIEGLRDAVTETLLNTSLQGVRVGVMKYPDAIVGSDASVGKGAKLVYPVVDIDDIDEGDLPETAARAISGKDDAHQTKINGSTKNVSVDSNVMLMGNLSANYSGQERVFDLDVDRYNTLFLLPRIDAGAAYDSFTYSNAISYVCSLILDDEAEFCKSSVFNTTGIAAGRRNHVIETQTIDNESRNVITGLNGTGYNQTGYGDQALFIFKGVSIPADATITKAHLIITPKKDGFYKSNGSSFCSLSSYGAKGEAEWINWRVSSARNFPAPSVDSPIYNTTGTTSDFNFYLKTGSADYAPRYWGVRQNETRWNNDTGGDIDSSWGKPQEIGATCWWQENKKITLNITTAIQEALKISTTDNATVLTYQNNFKSAAAASGAPMADLAIRFWTGGGAAYSKPYHTIGSEAPKLKLTYTSNQTGSSDAAVRFNNVYIPQGATITKAKIKLIPAGGDDKPANLIIKGEKTADAKEFSATVSDFSTRAKTAANQPWLITDVWKTNAGDNSATKYVETPDVSNILNEIVQSKDWCGGQSVAFFIENNGGQGYRSAFTYDESTSFRPVLEFEYTGGETGCMTKTWEETLSSRSADGYQTGGSVVPILSGNILYAYTNYRVGAYFSNVLLRNPKDTAANTADLSDKGLVSAELILVPNINVLETNITIAFDNAVNAERLKAARDDLGSRTLFPVSTTCTIPQYSMGQKISCDITDMVRAKIQQEVSVSGGKVSWQSGNSLAVIIQRQNRDIQFKPYETGFTNAMKIKITAKAQLMAPNSLTIRRRIVNAVNEEEPTIGQTPTMPAMLEAARYISNYPSSNAPNGPYQGTFYWNGKPQPSPLLSSCQMTHLVLMSDGEANVNGTNWRRALVSYTGKPYRNSTIDCEYNGVADRPGVEACGQALVNFMSTKSQGLNTDGRENWVTTHAVAFGSKGAGTFLERLVNANNPANKGYYFYAETSDDLVKAFMEIMDTAKGTFYNYTSGQVAVSNDSRYTQRREIYYSLMEPSNRNHWSGNLKRFGLVYTRLSNGSMQAVLVDAKGEDAVTQTADGYWFISPLTTSWWYQSGNEGDGGDVHKGGVLARLADNPDDRKMYAIKNGVLFDFTAANVATSGASKITPDDMETPVNEGQDILKATKGYVNFLRGYTFNAEGTTTTDSIIAKQDLRLGDFAHSAVTFAAYGQCLSNSKASVIECDASSNYDDYTFLDKGLQQVAFLAGNDGFFRAFDVRNGEQLYAVIPSEMLPVIPILQKRETIGLDVARLYGLDGTIKLFHDDANKDGYINNGEKAIAYVSAGRGGRVMYAIDVSNMSSPSLLWKIEGGKGGTFDNLGYTWSTPVTGKMRIGGSVKNVVIFGGGYDPQQDSVEVRTTDGMGNGIYILDAITGQLLWKADQSNSPSMRYSIPSPVSVLASGKDENENTLITDIFVGDMGGQLWRFHFGADKIIAAGDKGVVARVGSDGDKSLAQRIYMAPGVYEFIDSENQGTLSVSIGTGYLGHPLATYNKDKFYSFRLETIPSGSTVLTESNLAEVNQSTIADKDNSITQDPNFQQNGFYVNFGGADSSGGSGNGLGEKMISPLTTSRDITDGAESAGVYFSTYVPNPNNMQTCKLASGWQRSYGINLLTGESFFDSLFRTSTIIGIPPGVALYCEGNWCTPVWNYEDLSREGGGGKGPVKVSGGNYTKTGWTDLFEPL